MIQIFSFILAFAFLLNSADAKEIWKIATLEWPPFTCSQCPDQGAGSYALKQVLASQGVAVEFHFFPWSRALKMAKSNEFVGYYPGWPEVLKMGLFHHLQYLNPPLDFSFQSQNLLLGVN